MNNSIKIHYKPTMIQKLTLSVIALVFSAFTVAAQCSIACPLTPLASIQLEEAVGSTEITPEFFLGPDYALGCPSLDVTVTLSDLEGTVLPQSTIVDLDRVGTRLLYRIDESTTGASCQGFLEVYSDGPVTMNVLSRSASIESIFCVPISVENFYQLIGGQWMLEWDPAVLSFSNVSNSQLFMLTIDDSNTAAGQLGFDWVHGGVTSWEIRSNDDILMSVCFEGQSLTTGTDICVAPGATFDRSGSGITTVNSTCGSVSLFTCTLPCLPELNVSLTGSEPISYEADYFLLHDSCESDVSVTITDALGNDLGNTISSDQAGQLLTATVTSAGTGKSCTTALTVEECLAEPVDIEFSSRVDSSQMIVDLRVANAQDILGYQFAISYNPEVLAFNTQIDNSQSFENGGTTTGNSEDEGLISVVRVADFNNPASFDNGEILMTLFFDILKDENTTISLDPSAVESLFVSEGLIEHCVHAPAREIRVTGSRVSGTILDDFNQDCTATVDEEGISGWILELKEITSEFTSYGYTKDDGSYLIFAPPGNYILTVMPPNGLWGLCENAVPVVLPNEMDAVNQDFLASADVLCTDMVVDVGTNLLRRCFDNAYTVEYCNHGTTDATDVFIEVELDEQFTFVESLFPDFTIDGSTLTFNVGDVAYGDCGSFSFWINVACDGTTIGQTHCVMATIFPHEPCDLPSTSWSGASLVVEGECDGDNTIFRIRNTGTGNMQGAQEFIVIEDDVMKPGPPIQLDADEVFELEPLPADGKTYRVLIPQVPFHPGLSFPTLAIEGCGQANNGTISTGFVTMFPNDDGDSFVDIDCVENRGAYDPNDKAVSPKGYTDRRLVESNTDLDYHIRFQNTGTDTAFRVIVRDDIDPNLDLSTLELGAFSHEYTLDIINERTLEFTFENIMLVDSFANEPLSHGFVKFKIKQMPDLEDGLLIDNDAAIFFDFNEPVITNLTEVEIGRIITTNTSESVDIELSVFPNPTADFVTVRHSYTKGPVTMELYDQSGRLVKYGTLKAESKVSLVGLAEGVYNYKLRDGQLALGNGMITKI